MDRIPHVKIFSFHAPLFFANASKLKEWLVQDLKRDQKQVRKMRAFQKVRAVNTFWKLLKRGSQGKKRQPLTQSADDEARTKASPPAEVTSTTSQDPIVMKFTPEGQMSHALTAMHKEQQRFKERQRQMAAAAGPLDRGAGIAAAQDWRAVIFDCGSVSMVDATGLQALTEIKDELEKRKIYFALAGAKLYVLRPAPTGMHVIGPCPHLLKLSAKVLQLLCALCILPFPLSPSCRNVRRTLHRARLEIDHFYTIHAAVKHAVMDVIPAAKALSAQMAANNPEKFRAALKQAVTEQHESRIEASKSMGHLHRHGRIQAAATPEDITDHTVVSLRSSPASDMHRSEADRDQSNSPIEREEPRHSAEVVPFEAPSDSDSTYSRHGRSRSLSEDGQTAAGQDVGMALVSHERVTLPSVALEEDEEFSTVQESASVTPPAPSTAHKNYQSDTAEV